MNVNEQINKIPLCWDFYWDQLHFQYPFLDKRVVHTVYIFW